MKPTIRAIETEYLGYRFRSRLEARWAHFFNTLGIAFTYEPEGFEMEADGQVVRYLPDFWLSDWKTWVEIKPEIPNDRERTLAKLLHEGHGAPVAVFCGVPGSHVIEVAATDIADGSVGFKWWGNVTLAECQFCRAVDLEYGLDRWEWRQIVTFELDSVPRLCSCGSGKQNAGNPQTHSATSPRLRRAYEAARSCRFERLPRHLRHAPEVA